MGTTKKRVVIIDDSVFMRTMLKLALGKMPNIEVVGIGEDGKQGLDLIQKLKPDAVTLDIEMPGLTGLEVLERVGKNSKTPIVVVSTKTKRGAAVTVQALERGAFTCVAKPVAAVGGSSMQGFQSEVIAAIESALSSNSGALDQVGPVAKTSNSETNQAMIGAIGISAGGPATLHKIIHALPATFPAMVLTQHMPADFVEAYAMRLDEECPMKVKLAKQRDELKPGQILIAPGTHHLKVVRTAGRYRVALDDGPKVSGFKPSVDAMFSSLAECAGANVVSLVMTGMGFDGAEGTRLLKSKGAFCMAQDEKTSVVFGMPKAAIGTDCVDRIVALQDIPSALEHAFAQQPAKV
ncbi:MAG: chemotaxis response regulator protein-glutamate methylesterase [Phycisphaerae bacterium]|nr:MAG: chemotaxis response regulator protein-glutamate methylesterase [Phycisphaerae bacterium]